MTIKSPKISKNAITILITLGIIGIVYVFYFFVYVHNNEIAYQQRAFRELNKIGNNILAKNENNKKNAQTIFKSMEKEESLKSQKNSYKTNLEKIQILQDKIESLKEDLNYSKKQWDKNQINNTIIELTIELKNKHKQQRGLMSSIVEESDEIYEKLLDELNLNQSFSLIKIDNATDSLLNSIEDYKYLYYLDEQLKSENTYNSWRLKASLNEFINPMLNNDVFEELIIIRSDDQDVAFQTFENKIRLSSKDSLYHKHAGVNTAKISTFRTEETNYKIFTYNLTFENEEQWVIAGCIPEDEYLTEIRSISFWVIINAILFVILLMVGMPLLKLVLMNAVERLHRYNVLLTGLSVILVTLLIVLSFLIIYNLGYGVNRTDQNLKDLSEEISDKFKDEITTSYKQLAVFENALSYSLLSKMDIPSNKLDSLINDDNFKNAKDSVFAANSNIQFNEVFWMNNSGMQMIQYTLDNIESPLILLKDRSYFQQVINDRLWRHSKIDAPFYLQSLVSWTSGDHEIAISKKGENSLLPVAAITSKFKSVIDAILPMGYGFSIISPDGKVLIHSESDKNLQENFLEESEYNADLRTAIYGAVELNTNLDYLGRKHRAHIVPMDGMPLYLIVYYDMENLKTKISEVWSMTLLFILASISAIVILLFIIFIVRFRHSKLKKKLFYFDWMLPQERYHMKYKRFTLSNLVVILLIILFFKFGSSEDINIIFKLFVLPSLLFVLIHYQLNHFITKEMNKKILGISVLYIIVINLVFYSSVGSWKLNELWSNILFQILIICPFLLTSGEFSFWLKKPAKMKLLKSIKNQLYRFDKWLKSRSSFGNLRSTYSLFLSTWLLASAIIPAIFLYKTSYDIESEIWTKYTLLEMSRDIEKKFETEGDFKLKDTTNYSGIYHNFLGIDILKNDDSFRDTRDYKFDTILMHLRPGYKDAVIENKGLVYSYARDGSFHWKESDSLILLSHTLKDNKNTTIYLSKKVDKIHFLSSFNWMIIFILLTLCIVFQYVIYRVISFCVNKIYGIDFYSFVKKIDKDDRFTERIISENNTILIGLPGSGKTSFLKEYFKVEKDKNFPYFNCMTINDNTIWEASLEKLKKKNIKTVILDNFEYHNDDHATNSVKLRLLEKVLHMKLHIIIASEVHPTEIMNFYENTIAENSDEVPTSEYENELEIWRHIFRNFMETYKPLEQKEKVIEKVISEELKSLENAEFEKTVIIEELKHGNSLLNICPIIIEKIIAWKKLEETNGDHHKVKKKEEIKEDIILEIQQYAKSYYYALWNSLTKKEKYAVYDVAKDGFMNTLNKPVIHSLLRKGVLRFDDKLRLMNESFTNFVLSVVTVRETIQMDKEVSKKGKWVNIRLSIVLVLIALIALIGFGKPGFFENMNIIIIAITGVLSILPRLTSAFALTQKIK